MDKFHISKQGLENFIRSIVKDEIEKENQRQSDDFPEIVAKALKNQSTRSN